MRLLLIFMALALLAGCNSRAKDQGAADAIAGVDALVLKFGPLKDAALALIAEATKKNIEAARGRERDKLPPPQQTPAQIVDDPKTYDENANKTKEASLSGTFWAWIGGGALTLFTVALGIVRRVPGAHRPFIAVAQRFLENRRDKHLRKTEENLSSAAKAIAAAWDDLPPTAREIVLGRISIPARQALNAYRGEEKRQDG